MKIRMAYGKTGLDIDVPDKNLAGILRVKPVNGLSNPQSAIENAIRHPIDSKPLAEIVKGKKNACVVISDITRPIPNQIILPPILRILEENGIPREKITILIGTGIHRPNLGDELIGMVGEDIAKNYYIENHYSGKSEDLIYLGKTSTDIPIYINKYYVNADCKIMTGFIEPHLWAGYSGGRKGILPGITGLETMKYMHGYEMVAHPCTRYGQLEDNPFHEAGLEVAEMAGCDFLLNITMNEKKEITGVFAGNIVKAHLKGCEFCGSYSIAELPEPVDIAITSNGGYPADCSLYQSMKGMTTASGILREGGMILEFSRCHEGTGGKEFTELLESVKSVDHFFEKITAPGFFMTDQWGLQELFQLCRQYRIALYTEGISPVKIKQYQMEPVTDIQKFLFEAIEDYGPDCKIAVIPNGHYVIPRTPQSYTIP